MNRKLFLSVLFLMFMGQNVLATIVDEQGNEKTVVYVDMVADLFHAGHIALLKKAREYGDYLIVGLVSDEVCVEYKRLPILTLQERVDAVSACRYVDEVVADSPLCVTDEFLDEHHIDVVLHGDDYSQDQINLYYGTAVQHGIFKTLPYTKGISTTDIIHRIRSRDCEN